MYRSKRTLSAIMGDDTSNNSHSSPVANHDTEPPPKTRCTYGPFQPLNAKPKYPSISSQPTVSSQPPLHPSLQDQHSMAPSQPTHISSEELKKQPLHTKSKHLAISPQPTQGSSKKPEKPLGLPVEKTGNVAKSNPTSKFQPPLVGSRSATTGLLLHKTQPLRATQSSSIPSKMPAHAPLSGTTEQPVMSPKPGYKSFGTTQSFPQVKHTLLANKTPSSTFTPFSIAQKRITPDAPPPALVSPSTTHKSPMSTSSQPLENSFSPDFMRNGDGQSDEELSAQQLTDDDDVLLEESDDQRSARIPDSPPNLPQSNSVPNWPNEVEFDEKEKVLTIDDQGKHILVSGSIQARDVWKAKGKGLRYFVHLNDYNQPIRKGGSVLVKFIRDVIKMERYCPIGEVNWHKVHKKYKAGIVKIVRALFVIPDGALLDKAILKLAGRHLRQYRHDLKKRHYKTGVDRETLYQDVPSGHSGDGWIRLVDYWCTEKSEKLSSHGKKARGEQAHKHVTGSTSFANLRADLADECKKEPSQLLLFEKAYTPKGGNFAEDTRFQELLDKAKSMVEVRHAKSPTKSPTKIQDEVFNDLMYGGQVPKRPLTFGFGVNQGDVFGVTGSLRTEGYKASSKRPIDVMTNVKAAVTSLKKENEELVKKNQEMECKLDENNQMLKQICTQFSQALGAARSGKASTELLDAAQFALRMVDAQIPDTSSGNQRRSGRGDFHDFSDTPSP